MIRHIIRVSGDILEHDPIHPKMEFDNRFKLWKCPKRHAMLFVKPRITEFYEYNYILNDYTLVTTELCTQYYRPSEFYDHYYSPNEINKMNDNTIKNYIEYYSDSNCLFEVKVYKKFLKMKDRNIMKCIQSLITEKSYRVINELHANPMYTKRNIKFDETWNTIFYYHLLLPRLKSYFVNIKEFKCTCKKNCNHVRSILLRLLVFRRLKNNIDLYFFIKDLISVPCIV
jgi:hypothetical protein